MKLATLALALAIVAAPAPADDEWLTWTAARALAIGKVAYATGRVGSWFDTRLLKTERSFNYKLAATWMTLDAVRATARLAQLSEHLTADEARALVRDAEVPGQTVVMVEVDPREGSGVIPLDWTAALQPLTASGQVGRAMRGENTPTLGERKALRGTQRRNYDYDRFWVVFTLTHPDGSTLFPSDATAAELIVRIHDKEGRVKWPLPPGMRAAP